MGGWLRWRGMVKMETVAIIGAGIAGLTAGYYLSRRGFQVDVTDASALDMAKSIARKKL